MHSILQQHLGDPTPFLYNVFQQVDSKGIDIQDYELDHICYRVESDNSYNQICGLLREFANLLSETLIGGRLISTFKLHEPIQYEDRDIYCLEVPAPKEGSFYPQGYQHVEFVVNQELKSFIMMYPEIEFDTRSLHKDVNPDVKLEFANCSVKFHEFPLEYVIEHLE